MIEDMPLSANGKICRTVRLRNEGYDFVEEPERFCRSLADADLRADLFTFAQPIASPDPKYSYYQEWDTLAVLPIDFLRFVVEAPDQ